ncbi:MAG: SDR family NAD(P)-dependent oxidoreductase [Actinomycetota bacterium]|nr:SDR family NAD(P)-dependent oxidoreductase [Actinomycetota bacterium]
MTRAASPSAPVAVVAGAGGAGAATAGALAAAGFHVVVLDSREEAARAALSPVLAGGGSGESHAIDLLDIPAVQALHDDLVSRLGRVDVLIHLVGGWRGSATLEPASAENWFALQAPVVGTLAVLTSVFGATVRGSDTGRMFMVTSTAAARPTAGNVAYAAAKSAAEAWMAGVAHYLRDSAASAVVVAVKALLTDSMLAENPGKEWPGYTHVDVLAAALAHACLHPIDNGARVDLTAAGYSPT